MFRALGAIRFQKELFRDTRAHTTTRGAPETWSLRDPLKMGVMTPLIWGTDPI